jgi:hypothetical protein
MSDNLSREDEFLLKEYDTAVHLTFHVDEMRSKFTNLFITIVGAAAAGISILIQGNAKNPAFGNFETVVGVFLLLLAVAGILVIAVIAKLRRVQLENFRITNNVRKHFLGSNYALWNVVELSEKTLPFPTRTSGTYFWTSVLILLNSYVVALGVYLLFHQLVLAVIVILLLFLIQDRLYIRMAKPPKPPQYSKKSPPDQDAQQPA